MIKNEEIKKEREMQLEQKERQALSSFINKSVDVYFNIDT